jgi:hypothetical protein
MLDSLRCAVVRYGVKVTNLSSAEPLTLTALSDSEVGDITKVQGAIEATTCAVPQTVPAAGTTDQNQNPLDEYTCTFDARFCGGDHTDTLTATWADNDGNSSNKDSNSLTVNVDAYLPALP